MVNGYDKYAAKRAALKAIAKDEGASPEDRFNAWLSWLNCANVIPTRQVAPDVSAGPR